MAAVAGDAREIARIAYGFKASKALFTAIDLGVFARLSDGPQTLSALAADMNLADDLLGRAYESLPVGGMLVVHDFMVNDSRTGPPDAALWFLTCMFNAPDGIVLTPQRIEQRIKAAGFADVRIEELIPDLTRFAVAVKQP